MQKDILIITNYFPPEKGAAANRIFAMAKAYKQHGYKVSVVCPMPNYPYGKIFKNYNDKLEFKGIKIRRLWLYANNSKNKFLRLFSMLSFGLNLFLFLLFKSTPNKVIVQCSPLFVGFFAVLISKLKCKTIILNVSDLWPLAGFQMGILNKGYYYKLLERIESFNYKSADLVLGQSEEILTHIKTTLPEKNLFLYRNLPDFKTPKPIQKRSSKDIKIVYAGLLGVAQGVAKICQNIELPKNVFFDIYGDGPEAETINTVCKNNKQINLQGLVDRDKLHNVLMLYDYTLIPLTNRIYGSVPSKIFEYSKLGLPIIFFSEGEGNMLVQQYKLGFTLNDKDYKGLNTLLADLAKGRKSNLGHSNIAETAAEVFDFEAQFLKLLKITKTL